MESILASIKKALGISPDDNFFDPDIILHINSVFSVLTQLGVGPEGGYMLPDDGEGYWDEYIGNDTGKLQLVKTYMALKVKTYFDPPANSSVLSAIERQLTELEWRLNAQVDPGEQINGTGT